MKSLSMETLITRSADRIDLVDSRKMRMPGKTISTCFTLALAACTLLLPVRSALGQTSSAAKPARTHATAATTNSAHTQPWKTIAIPPLHDFKPVQPRRIELSNGLVIFLQEDHELPFIDGTVLIRGGSREQPAEKIGLVSLYGEAWRTSGTATTSGDALDTELAEKAAGIETGGGQANTSMEWSSFKQDFDTVFGKAVDLLRSEER